MNGAWNLPEEMKQSVGTKLDILCVSGHKKEISQIVSLYPNVVWMSPKSRETIEPEVTGLLYFKTKDEFTANCGHTFINFWSTFFNTKSGYFKYLKLRF